MLRHVWSQRNRIDAQLAQSSNHNGFDVRLKVIPNKYKPRSLGGRHPRLPGALGHHNDASSVHVSRWMCPDDVEIDSVDEIGTMKRQLKKKDIAVTAAIRYSVLLFKNH